MTIRFTAPALLALLLPTAAFTVDVPPLQPKPADEFSLYIRAYWPKAEILEDRWMPPAVVKTE